MAFPIKNFEIDSREIGNGQPVYLVAELSANHVGNLDTALKTIDAAQAAGAAAIKLQTYTADSMTIDCNENDFIISQGLWAGTSLYQLYEKAQTPYNWHEKLFSYCREKCMTVFSTPFDPQAVEFLESLNSPAYKIASFELLDKDLIECVSQTGKPVILSTGMASLDEIGEAVEWAKSAGVKSLVLLHCISAYPCPLEHYNLHRMSFLKKEFSVNIGLSDHTLGVEAAMLATALGACLVEKHFTLDRSLGGPDSTFSTEPDEFTELSSKIKRCWMSMGSTHFQRSDDEIQNMRFRRSLYVVNDINVGERFTRTNVRAIRPGFGLPIKYMQAVVGKQALATIKRGTALTWEHVQPNE